MDRPTKTNVEIDQTMDLDTCSEKDCGMSIMVEKELKLQGRKFRCTACLMRNRIQIPAKQ